MQDIHEVRLLLVDDEPELLAMLETLLSQEGFEQIRTASTAADALATAQDFVPQVVLLDVMLPDGDGFELFSQLRRQADIPVLFLSARDEDEARLRGLGLGADELHHQTLSAAGADASPLCSLAPHLCGGRAFSAGADPPWLRDGGYGQPGTVTGNGEEKMLTAKEYALLAKLNENRGRIVTVDSLCMAAWNDENVGYENTLMVHIRRLREKIEADPSHPRWLITVRGLGYRLLKEEKTL